MDWRKTERERKRERLRPAGIFSAVWISFARKPHPETFFLASQGHSSFPKRSYAI